MRSNAELELSPADLRASERFDTKMAVGIRRSGSRTIPAIVTDLSASGFRVEAEERLPNGAIVWLKLGALAPQMARVMWNRRLIAGCRFDVALSPYVLEQFRVFTASNASGD
jgi:hypothetical protein